MEKYFGTITNVTSGAIRGLNSSEFDHKTRVVNGRLRAEYLANKAGGKEGGFLFDRKFTSSEEAMLEYQFKFDANFTWAYGGKLPGLGGHDGRYNLPAGCTSNTNNIDNGFSCRFMWRQSGAGKPARLVVYTYLPDRTKRCGEDILVFSGLEKNKWYTLKQYIKLNTPGQRNGIMKVWVNGSLKVDLNNVYYRKSGKSNVKLNSLIMHTYRGGSATDPIWWSPNKDYAEFDNFKLWRCTEESSSFTLQGNKYYKFRNVATGRYMDSNGAGTSYGSKTLVKTSTSNGGYDKQWRLLSRGSGFYNIDCRAGGRGCLDADGSGRVFHNTVESSTIDDKEWKAIQVRDNIYRFNNRINGRGNLHENSSGTIVYSSSTSTRSQWELIEVKSNGEPIEPVVAATPLEAADATFNPTAFPNPTSGWVSVRGLTAEVADVKVFNIAGAQVQGLRTEAFQGGLDLDLTSQRAGIYLVSVTQNGEHRVLRVTRR